MQPLIFSKSNPLHLTLVYYYVFNDTNSAVHGQK
ncbi:Uncharacterised protein [Bacteroides heparinolyticus]|uniref:Uncharacterized protein n=1 Tax=Prevotella heparinolytica TaxID=28113 RepID=A0A449I2W4_9BACE|nr:Uncharacterised protein [Bacteroides heparinolyticus]